MQVMNIANYNSLNKLSFGGKRRLSIDEIYRLSSKVDSALKGANFSPVQDSEYFSNDPKQVLFIWVDKMNGLGDALRPFNAKRKPRHTFGGFSKDIPLNEYELPNGKGVTLRIALRQPQTK